MNIVSKDNTSPDTLGNNSKRLPDFISGRVESIVSEWELFARSLTPSSTGMTTLALRDHIHEILEFVVADIHSSQTDKEQARKSKGEKAKTSVKTAAEIHASLRLDGGFNVEQMVSEYRALRASVIKLWSRTNPSMDLDDINDIIRFNESVDQALAESIAYYTKEVFHSKDIFVGILTHDIRNPLQAITLYTELILRTATLTERQLFFVKGTLESASRIGSLIDNLLDVTRARFGAGLTIIRSSIDAGFMAHQIVDEMRTVHPTRAITLDVSGDLRADWDKARIGQVFSNLISNAMQYGFKNTPVDVMLRGISDVIEITIHNIGVPIPLDKINTIFDPLTRADSKSEDQSVNINLGLGLFITREIVQSHDGLISVVSSEENGTTFTIQIPRRKSTPSLRLA